MVVANLFFLKGWSYKLIQG